MKFGLISLLISGISLWGGNQQPLLQPIEYNVNSRYTVESIDVSPEIESRISRGLKHDLQILIGQKLNPTALNDLARRMRDELKVRTVSQKLLRGTAPEHVRVVMEVAHKRGEFDLSVPRLLYNSSQGWTGGVDATAVMGNHAITAGLLSNNEDLAERYTGVRARYEDRRLGNDRLRFQFDFASYHDQWSPTASANPAGGSLGLYRSRQSFEPVATVALNKELSFSFGAGFQRFDPELRSAHTQSANAAITALRYQGRFEGWGADQQELEAGYSLRAGTKFLNSDLAYVRHRWMLRYSFTKGRQTVSDQFIAGLATGQAPLFERYVLGTGTMLRGWDKDDLDPRGGSRMVYNSLEYRYSVVDVFYETGAIWDSGQDLGIHHSVGVGLRKNSFLIAMAFPVKGGRATPVFLVGLNY